MKKGMMVMTMFVALSFLISISAVSPSFAKQATQTTSTTKQQGPAQTPQTQTIKPPAGPTKTYEMAKEKFWGLEADHCNVNGVLWSTSSNKLTLKVGPPVPFTCWYTVKTIPVKDITESDAAAWGTGKSYIICSNVLNIDTKATFKKEETKSLPKFTWADVQKWKGAGQGNAPRIWTIAMAFTWTPTQEYLGASNFFDFGVDCPDVIEENEYDAGPNNHIYGAITVNP